MTRNPIDPLFWNETDLRKELDRINDICHGCRLCFNLCPSFPALFKYVDENDGEAGKLNARQIAEITDLCYQCKLCYVKCPYTPPHQYDLDFPRLMLREKAVRVKREGVSLQDRFLGNPDRTGRMGCRMAPLSNLANSSPIFRVVMEKTVGVHRDRNLPEFQPILFEEWFRNRPRPLRSEKKVAFFYTCFVNYHEPDPGVATVEVLEKNGYEVIAPEQVCCGMPFLDGGEIGKAAGNMEQNIRSFKPFVEAGIPIVSLGPTCSYVLKNEQHFITQNPDAAAMGKATKDVCEFLVELKNRRELNTEFKNIEPAKIAYQIPCHLKAQNMGYKSMDLLRVIPNMKVELMENCSAMDGTWGMKKQYFERSLKVAGKLFREVNQAQADHVCTDCPLSGMQIDYGTKRKPVHPVQILHRAYGL